jgi:hypothetical protein
VQSVAILFARRDSVYKTLAGCDVYDFDRNARSFRGGVPVVAHPPCRGWGKLYYFAKPIRGEKELGIWAVHVVRKCGGVLEHPSHSKLWKVCDMPKPGHFDVHGGFTFAVSQHWWGHRATKLTWLYVVGLHPSEFPPIPMTLGEGTHVIAQSRVKRKDGIRLRKGMVGWRPEVSKAEREHTPQAFAEWLVELARRCAHG